MIIAFSSIFFFSSASQLSQHAIKSSDDSFALYKIAFQWYPFLGVILTWLPAIFISYITGGQNFANFNIQLLSPCAQWLVPKKYRHKELELKSGARKIYNDESKPLH